MDASEAQRAAPKVFHAPLPEAVETLSAELGPLILREVPEAAASAGPSPRELRVLSHLGRGPRDREIAERLRISEHPVTFHAGSLLSEPEVRSRGEAAALTHGRATIYR